MDECCLLRTWLPNPEPVHRVRARAQAHIRRREAQAVNAAGRRRQLERDRAAGLVALIAGSR